MGLFQCILPAALGRGALKAGYGLPQEHCQVVVAHLYNTPIAKFHWDAPGQGCWCLKHMDMININKQVQVVIWMWDCIYEGEEQASFPTIFTINPASGCLQPGLQSIFGWGAPKPIGPTVSPTPMAKMRKSLTQ